MPETVLVVDDDRVVRDLTRRTLEAAGYQVLEASGGRAALEIVRRATGPIRVVVTDVEMPEMSGPELAGALRELRPGIPLIYITGDPAALRCVLRDGDGAVLAKPFSPAALLVAVRRTVP